MLIVEAATWWALGAAYTHRPFRHQVWRKSPHCRDFGAVCVVREDSLGDERAERWVGALALRTPPPHLRVAQLLAYPFLWSHSRVAVAVVAVLALKGFALCVARGAPSREAPPCVNGNRADDGEKQPGDAKGGPGGGSTGAAAAAAAAAGRRRLSLRSLGETMCVSGIRGRCDDRADLRCRRGVCPFHLRGSLGGQVHLGPRRGVGRGWWQRRWWRWWEAATCRQGQRRRRRGWRWRRRP